MTKKIIASVLFFGVCGMQASEAKKPMSPTDGLPSLNSTLGSVFTSLYDLRTGKKTEVVLTKNPLSPADIEVYNKEQEELAGVTPRTASIMRSLYDQKFTPAEVKALMPLLKDGKTLLEAIALMNFKAKD